jgi:hypothetical protein
MKENVKWVGPYFLEGLGVGHLETKLIMNSIYIYICFYLFICEQIIKYNIN